MQRTCIRCEETKEIEEFGWHKKSTGLRRTLCKKCRNKDTMVYRRSRRAHFNKQSRENTRRRKEEWIAKKGGKCEVCDGTFHPSVYEFHHVDPSEKEVSPGQLFCRKEETIAKELKKCILLCANCHRLEHHKY